MKSMVIGLTAFLPSEDQLGQLFLGQTTDIREMIEEVASWGVEIVVVKRAWQGQMVFHSATKKCYEIPAYPSKMVDPTGAGDVFAGGFLAGLAITGSPPRRSCMAMSLPRLRLKAAGLSILRMPFPACSKPGWRVSGTRSGRFDG